MFGMTETCGQEPQLERQVSLPPQINDLLVVIVNWNTGMLLEKCLTSLAHAVDGLSVRTVVVDNASTDGSAEIVARKFPSAELIHNHENVGYARANNQALLPYADDASYTLLLNPDTEVPVGTLRAMIDFMESHGEAGIAGCRVVRPDGQLDWACKRGHLKPSALFYRALRLDRMFPNSRRFATYSLTYLDDNGIHEVTTVAGAFMMIRRECLAATGLLDESYFMYSEDTDLCYRAKALGWKVFYAPVGTILHHKGVSTSKRSYTMIRHWYSSTWKLYRKQIGPKYSAMVNALVWSGLWTMCAVSLAANFLRPTKRVPSRR
jgi:GT2 family glycosyltransferase